MPLFRPLMVAVLLSGACMLEPDALLPPVPPGHALAYVSGGVFNNGDIFVLSGDGSSDQNVTQSAAFDFWPAWSPLGDRTAFVSNRDSAGFDIYLMSATGGSVRRLTTDSGDSVHPAWSPTGDRIAFASDSGGGGPPEFQVRDTRGGNG